MYIGIENKIVLDNDNVWYKNAPLKKYKNPFHIYFKHNIFIPFCQPALVGTDMIYHIRILPKLACLFKRIQWHAFSFWRQISTWPVRMKDAKCNMQNDFSSEMQTVTDR